MSEPIRVYDVKTGEEHVFAAPGWVEEQVTEGVFTYRPPGDKEKDNPNWLERLPLDRLKIVANEVGVKGAHLYKNPESLVEAIRAVQAKEKK